MATAKGHMHQTRKNINSTKQQEKIRQEEIPMTPLAQWNKTFSTKSINHTIEINTDLTGKYPVTSNRGNKYLFILYEYDRNSILIHPAKAILDSNFSWVFKYLHENLLIRGIKPAYTRLYNKYSTAFQREPKSKDTKFQIEPPGMHSRNTAERATIAFNYQFIAELCSTDPYHPMKTGTASYNRRRLH